MGTQQKSDVDVDWLPKETTTEFGMILCMEKLHGNKLETNS
jgi:hypothetical protein